MPPRTQACHDVPAEEAGRAGDQHALQRAFLSSRGAS
jgi:hypothetical protein